MNQPNDELLWLAYRFSAGELSAEETLEFEARLAVDQAAREALAQAVGLTETVRAVERSAQVAAVMPASVGRRNWSQEAGWIAAGVAACIAVVMTWQVFRADRVEVARRTNSQGIVAAEVGPVDDETRLLLAMLAEAPNARSAAPLATIEAENLAEPEEMGEAEFELVLDDGTTETSHEDQNATPDWLLAAVAESQS